MHSFCKKISEGYQPDLQEIINELGAIFPLLNNLVDTPQDPEWHAEGNVYIHTGMVLSALYTLINAQEKNLTCDEILALVLAAALHDIAKPINTRKMEIGGVERIVAPNHEYRGGSYIAYKLADLELPFSIVYNIISLVAYHIKPKLLVVKNENITPFHYNKTARAVDLKLLFYLEKADMMGRECSDQKKQIEHIDLFKLFAQEFGLWPNKKPYEEWKNLIDKELFSYSLQTKKLVLANAIKEAEAGNICTVEAEISRSFSYRERFSELVVLCGPSGAGKTTWIKNNLPDFEVVSLDQLRKEMTGDQSDQSKNGQVLQAAKKILKIHLAKKRNIIWDATNLRKDFRKQIVDLGYAYKAFVTIIWFYRPISSFYSQNKKRQRQVADNIITRQLDSFEWPEPYEAHAYKVVDQNGSILFES